MNTRKTGKRPPRGRPLQSDKRKKKDLKLTAEEFDRRFDAGESLPNLGVDLSEGKRLVNIGLPLWAIKALDKEANRRGITRQALMKAWLLDRLDPIKKKRT